MDEAHNKLLERLRTYYGDDLACRTLLMDARHALEALAGEVAQVNRAAQESCAQMNDALGKATAERDRLKAALQQIASQKSFAELEAGTEDDDVDYDLIGAWDIVIGVARKAVGGAS